MGNINIITNEKDEVVGRGDFGLASFSIVMEIAKKYNPDLHLYESPLYKSILPDNCNEILEPCYENGEDYEVVQLMIFLNDVSEFDKEDIPALEKAIKKCKFKDEDIGPRKILISFKKMIEKHGKIIKTYKSTYASMMVTKGNEDE